jgi:hypothetical protein
MNCKEFMERDCVQVLFIIHLVYRWFFPETRLNTGKLIELENPECEK